MKHVHARPLLFGDGVSLCVFDFSRFRSDDIRYATPNICLWACVRLCVCVDVCVVALDVSVGVRSCVTMYGCACVTTAVCVFVTCAIRLGGQVPFGEVKQGLVPLLLLLLLCFVLVFFRCARSRFRSDSAALKKTTGASVNCCLLFCRIG